MLSRKTVVRLKDARKAEGDLERLVCRILEIDGPSAVSELVKRVAKEMYNDALKHGGSSVDIGIFGPSLFERDVFAVLDSMKDQCISVESENGR